MLNKTLLIRGLSTVVAASSLLLIGGCQRESSATQRDRNDNSAMPGRSGSDYSHEREREQERDMERRREHERDTAQHMGVKNDAAISQIASARCARDRSCNNIGADKKWSSDAACESEILTKTRDELNIGECPGGVDQKALSDCLDSIHKEECNSPLDSMSRLMSCRSGELCKSHLSPIELARARLGLGRAEQRAEVT